MMILIGGKCMSWISDVKYEMNNLEISRKKLRQFGITIGIIIAVLVIWFQYPGPIHYLGYILLIFSLFLFVGGIFFPQALKSLFKVWMGFAFFLGWIVSRFLLTIIFIVVMTPISILAKLFGKQFINRTFKGNEKSYWVKKENAKIKYDKMF